MQHLSASSDDADHGTALEPRAPGVRSTDVQPDDLSAHRAPNSRKRSAFKTVSWRVTATTTTFLIAWVVTGDLGAGAAIGGVEAVAKMFLYYGHERAWEHVPA